MIHSRIASNVPKFYQRLWHSPTFTTWGNQAVQGLQLVAVTPLILTRFDAPEIAAWYLFASLFIFGQIINGRMGLTFSRMIAFAMSGAGDLSPIKDNKSKRGSGTPNWLILERAYSTIGGLNLFLSVVTMTVAAGMGYFGLRGIAAEHTYPNQIWLAFAIMMGSQTLVFIFQKYNVALRGMDYVALSSRWDMIFSLLSIASGFIALSFGANIWQLALVMQSFVVLGLLRSRLLLFWVEGGRARQFREFGFDRQIWRWAAEPFTKGLAVNLANSGVIHFGAIIYASQVSVEAAAAFLFTLKMLLTLKKFSETPFRSHLPKMSRLMAQHKIQALAKMVQQRTLIAQGIFCVGSLIFCAAAPFLLDFIGANASILSFEQSLLLATLLLVQNYIIMSLTVSILGNHIVCFWREVFAAAVSFPLLLLLVPQWPFQGVLIAVFLPQVIFLNFRPTRIAAERLHMTAGHLFWRGTGPVAALQSCVLLGTFLFFRL